MKKKHMLLMTTLLIGFAGTAANSQVLALSWPFSAPAVSDHSSVDVENGKGGQIVFESATYPTAGTFYGWNGASWIQLNAGAPSNFATRILTAGGAISVSDDILILEGSGNYTATLPDSNGNLGKTFMLVHNGTSYSENYYIAAAAGETINGSAGYLLIAKGDSIKIVADGSSNWVILNKSYNGNLGTTSWAGVINCLWQSTAASFANYTADAHCTSVATTGMTTTPSTNIPAMTVTTLPYGTYRVTAQFTYFTGTSTACAFRISDGTTNSSPVFVNQGQQRNPVAISSIFTYSADQSNLTFQIQNQRSGSNSCDIENTSATNESVTFDIVRID